jgi:hypothetical protein
MVGNDKNRIRRNSSGSSRLLLSVQKPKNFSHYQKNIEKQFATSSDIERGRTSFGFCAAQCYKQYSYFEHKPRAVKSDYQTLLCRKFVLVTL